MLLVIKRNKILTGTLQGVILNENNELKNRKDSFLFYYCTYLKCPGQTILWRQRVDLRGADGVTAN